MRKAPSVFACVLPYGWSLLVFGSGPGLLSASDTKCQKHDDSLNNKLCSFLSPHHLFPNQAWLAFHHIVFTFTLPVLTLAGFKEVCKLSPFFPFTFWDLLQRVTDRLQFTGTAAMANLLTLHYCRSNCVRNGGFISFCIIRKQLNNNDTHMIPQYLPSLKRTLFLCPAGWETFEGGLKQNIICLICCQLHTKGFFLQALDRQKLVPLILLLSWTLASPATSRFLYRRLYLASPTFSPILTNTPHLHWCFGHELLPTDLQHLLSCFEKGFPLSRSQFYSTWKRENKKASTVIPCILLLYSLWISWGSSAGTSPRHLASGSSTHACPLCLNLSSLCPFLKLTTLGIEIFAFCSIFMNGCGFHPLPSTMRDPNRDLTLSKKQLIG